MIEKKQYERIWGGVTQLVSPWLVGWSVGRVVLDIRRKCTEIKFVHEIDQWARCLGFAGQEAIPAKDQTNSFCLGSGSIATSPGRK
jgi:hypothetical protein